MTVTSQHYVIIQHESHKDPLWRTPPEKKQIQKKHGLNGLRAYRTSVVNALKETKARGVQSHSSLCLQLLDDLYSQHHITGTI